MAETKKKFEVIKKYYFRKDGIVKGEGYDWIGEVCHDLYPVELNGKLGFADCNGEIVVPIIYDKQGHINDTVWTGNDTYLDLKMNKLCGLIKHDGTVVIEFQWEDMRLNKLSEELIPVAIHGKWGFVNVTTGKTQIEPIYDDVTFFKEGFSPVCIENKWGMIDKDGNMIIQPKYLLDTYFDGDFAIMFEGGSWSYYEGKRSISDSNCKIVNKKGCEIFTDYSWIERTGINTFILERKVNNKRIKSLKQLVALDDYIIIIDDGEYLAGYITTEGNYSEKYVDKSTRYIHAKYTGGGTWSAIDYTGKPIINIPNDQLQKIKESLLV